MEKQRLFYLFLFGLLMTPCLLFSAGTGVAQDLSESHDPLGDCNAISSPSENESQASNNNITKLNDCSKANFLLNWAEYKFPGLFPSGPVTQYMTQPEAFYRAYSTNVLLGTHRDHIYLLDQQSQLTDYGVVDDWVAIAQDPNAGEVMFGYVFSSISLDRDPGQGDCGIGPWADPYCTSLKIWWKMQLKAFAMSPVLIIPDGENRWVITNLGAVAEKYSVSLPDSSDLGTYQYMFLDPSVTNPECTVAQFEGADFSFQVMGTRENGLTELIISSNAIESTAGNCMQAAFAYETTYLLNGWAAGLSGDPMDLRVELNDTFMNAPGQYTFINTIDTNPSPENRDHVRVELGFYCTDSISGPGVHESIPCPWE